MRKIEINLTLQFKIPESGLNFNGVLLCDSVNSLQEYFCFFSLYLVQASSLHFTSWLSQVCPLQQFPFSLLLAQKSEATTEYFYMPCKEGKGSVYPERSPFHSSSNETNYGYNPYYQVYSVVNHFSISFLTHISPL